MAYVSPFGNKAPTVQQHGYISPFSKDPAPQPKLTASVKENPFATKTDFKSLDAPTFDVSPDPALSLKNQVLSHLPFTPLGRDVIEKNLNIGIGQVDPGAGAQTLIGNPALGKTKITLSSAKTPQDELALSHEVFNSFFLRGNVSPVDFNKAWEAAKSSNDANAKVLKTIDAQFKKPENQQAFNGKTGENVTTGDPYYLASERFAYAGSMLGLDGISAIPKNLQGYYKNYISDFPQEPVKNTNQFKTATDIRGAGNTNAVIDTANFLKNLITHPIATMDRYSDPLFSAVGGDLVSRPVETLNKIVNGASQQTDKVLNNLVSSAEQFRSDVLGTPGAKNGQIVNTSTNRTTSEKIGSTLNLLYAIASTVFFPVSETYTIASQLPVIKPVADAIGVIFSKAGQVTSFSADKLLETLPISQQAKDNLKAPIDNVSSLVGQIILGGYIYGKITGVMDVNGKVSDANLKKIHEEASQKSQEINKEANRPMPPPDKLQPQDVQATQSAEIPKSGYVSPFQNSDGTKQASGVADTISGTDSAIQPIQGTGEIKVRGLSQGVEEKAIENKLTSGFGELPTYETVNMKDQARMVTDLMDKDYEQAKRVATGQENAPQGILPESIFIGVENRAIAEGDVNTLRDLANSKLTQEATTMGQRIRTLGERDPESPVTAIEDLAKAREDALVKKSKIKDVAKAKRQIAENIKKEITKVSPTKETWSSFIDSLKC